MSLIVKEPKRSVGKSAKSFAVKEQLRIGGEIAAALPQLMSQTQVAAKLGICQQLVSRTERRALYKLRALLLAKGEVVANHLPVVVSRVNGN